MSFNFPASPSNGQTYTPVGGPVFTWDGTAWKALSQGMPVTVFVGDVAPSAPAFGNLWWESDTGNLYIYYNDDDSTQWVQINGTPARSGEIKRTVVDGNAGPGGDVSGSYVKPVGLKYVDVEIWGGGAAGGGVPTLTTGQRGAGVGGGSGGYCKKLYAAADLAASEAYVIGKGGNTPSGVGGDGGTSTFKGLTANGGVGGGIGTPATTDGGAPRVGGGTASGGDINTVGGHSGSAFWLASGTTMAGNGGAAPFGTMVCGRGNGAGGATSNGSAGNAPGGGGAGGAVAATGSGATGGVGAGGRIVFTEYF